MESLHAYVLEVAEQLRRERILDKAEVDRHFQLKAEHIKLLEESINTRFVVSEKALYERTASMTAVSADRLAWIKDRFIIVDQSIQARFDAGITLQTAVQAAAKEGIEKAERQTDQRFESVNEFRRTLSDQTATFLTRAAFDEAQKSALSRFEQIQSRLNVLDGQSLGTKESREDSRQNWAMVVAIASVVITILLTLIPVVTKVAATNTTASPLYNVPPGYRLVPLVPLESK